MEVAKAIEQLCRHLEHLVFRYALLFFLLFLNLLEQATAITQFHHNAHLLLRSAPIFDNKVIFYFNDVRMVNFLHQPHFFLIDILIRVIHDLTLFDRKSFAILYSCDFLNQTKVCSVQYLAKCVLLSQFAA